MLLQWLESWKSWKPSSRNRRRLGSVRKLPSDIQVLEQRLLLTNYIVDTPDDVPSDPGTDGKISLREAILAANTNSQVGDAPPGQAGGPSGVVDTITFAGSLAGQTLSLDNGDLNITDDLTITGLGSSQLTVDAQGNSRIFTINTAITVSISGMTLTHGSAYLADGGAIYNSGGTLSLTDVTLTGNTSEGGDGGGNGGALYNENGSVTISSSMIANNSAQYGGGISNLNGSITIDNSSIDNNIAEYSGGAIDNYFDLGSGTATVTIMNSTIANNSASFGGGIDNGQGTIILDRSTISGNTADGVEGGQGGGIDSYLGTQKITNSTISGNTANGDGGGLHLYSVSDPLTTITNSTISGNTANGGGYGGGVYNAGDTLLITNSTLVNNYAQGSGAPGGGGIYTANSLPTSTTTLQNTIVAGNLSDFSGTGPTPNAPSDIGGILLDTQSGYNLIGDPLTAGGLMEGVNGNRVGDGAGNLLPLDQILDPTLQNNGGPTQTHQLVVTGRAIDGGSNALAVDPNNDNIALATDQRGTGFDRVVDIPNVPNAAGGVDIGAVEFQQSTLYLYALDADKLEGNSGSTPFTFIVYRTGSTGGSDTVNYAVTGITADASDFVGGVLPSGTVPFAANETQKTITVSVKGDQILEPNEFFTVTLSNPSMGASIGTATAQGEIRNDENIEVFGAGSGTGIGSMPPIVTEILAGTGETLRSFNAYAAGFLGGVRVAAADVNGDGVADIITAAGPEAGRTSRFLMG